MDSVDALEAVDELLGEGFAGFGPEEAAADAAVFFDREGEGQKHFDILLDVFGGVFVELLVGEGFGEPGGVEAEVDADVAVLFEAGVVELGAEAEDADRGGLELPEGFEGGGFVFGVGVGVGFGFGVGVGWGFIQFGGPEAPAHFELIGHVVVKLLGGFGYGAFDDGAGGVLVFFGAIVVDVDALVGGGFGEADGVDGGGVDALAGGVVGAADEGELAHDRDQRGREGVEAEVGEPETEVELIGHGSSLWHFCSRLAGGKRRAVVLCTMPTLGAKCAPKMGHPIRWGWEGGGVGRRTVAFCMMLTLAQ